MSKFCIIDYGVGNLYSLNNAFEHLGVETIISSSREEIDQCRAIFLPGVGAFPDAMRLMNDRNLVTILKEQAAKGKWIIGICLGLQLLFEEGTEVSYCKGLGLLKGKVIELPDQVKKPHMGWNQLQFQRPDSPLLKGVKENSAVYFVHSFHAVAENPSDVVATTDYGVSVPAIVSRDRILGLQFHPEKSGKDGMQLLKNLKEMIL